MPLYIKIAPHERYCKNCIHFHQHYYWENNTTLRKVDSGHCDTPKLKNVSAVDYVCELFENRNKQKAEISPYTNKFVVQIHE